jgi:hypothetical protein
MNKKVNIQHLRNNSICLFIEITKNILSKTSKNQKIYYRLKINPNKRKMIFLLNALEILMIMTQIILDKNN